jgi:DNA (cytosine-5)-methyltransferase 1
MDAYVGRYEKASSCVTPRDLHPDAPARTLTCRNLAGATGDMHRIRLPDGRRRRLLAREAARLQSFPDWFEFTGGETSVFNQIGNAVAPLFAYHLAKSVRAYLESTERFDLVAISKRKPLVQADLFAQPE